MKVIDFPAHSKPAYMDIKHVSPNLGLGLTAHLMDKFNRGVVINHARSQGITQAKIFPFQHNLINRYLLVASFSKDWIDEEIFNYVIKTNEQYDKLKIIKERYNIQFEPIKFHKIQMIWNYVDKQTQKIVYPNFRRSIFHDTIQRENREIIERIYYKAEWGDRIAMTLKNYKDNKKKYFL